MPTCAITHIFNFKIVKYKMHSKSQEYVNKYAKFGAN